MLTETRIRQAKPRQMPYKLTNHAGLYLEVRTGGKTLWRDRYRLSGEENLYAAGTKAVPIKRGAKII